MIILILIASALAHLSYREDLPPLTEHLNTYDFFSHKEADWLLNFGMHDCQACTDLADEWAFVHSDQVRLARVNCSDILSVTLCKYFGLSSVPQIVRVTQGNYYFMPATIDKTSRNIQIFMDSKYPEAFI